MKKFILILLGLTFTTSSAYALKTHYENIPYGEYKCSENNEICTIYKYKTGEITFSRECLEDIHSTISTYAPKIKRNKCQALTDSTKYYIYEFADTKCNVILYPHSTSVSCMDKKKQNIPTEQRVRLNNKVIQFAKEGKCRDMYPTPQAESSK